MHVCQCKCKCKYGCMHTHVCHCSNKCVSALNVDQFIHSSSIFSSQLLISSDPFSYFLEIVLFGSIHLNVNNNIPISFLQISFLFSLSYLFIICIYSCAYYIELILLEGRYYLLSFHF